MCTSLVNMYTTALTIPSISSKYVGTFPASIACRSHQRIDDTPMFTPTHKYNVWEDDRHNTGATPRFSKGKRRLLGYHGIATVQQLFSKKNKTNNKMSKHCLRNCYPMFKHFLYLDTSRKTKICSEKLRPYSQ